VAGHVDQTSARNSPAQFGDAEAGQNDPGYSVNPITSVAAHGVPEGADQGDDDAPPEKRSCKDTRHCGERAGRLKPACRRQRSEDGGEHDDGGGIGEREQDRCHQVLSPASNGDSLRDFVVALLRPEDFQSEVHKEKPCRDVQRLLMRKHESREVG